MITVGDQIFALNKEIKDLKKQLETQKAIALEIYKAGCWHADKLTVEQEVELWTKFRDVFGIGPGTATANNVAPKTNS